MAEVGVRTADVAFSEFYSQHLPRLVGSLVLYTGDRELAMDIAQETMARAYRDWRKVSGFEAPAAWLHRVAFNVSNSFFRRGKLERRTAHLNVTEEVAADGGGAEAIALRALVAALPKRQRTALVLRFYADLSVRETATAMGCAEGTVRALTSQALGSLRRSGLDIEGEVDG